VSRDYNTTMPPAVKKPTKHELALKYYQPIHIDLSENESEERFILKDEDGEELRLGIE
jgi:hypothetical protein